MPYNPGRYFAPRYWADNYFDTEADVGGVSPITADIAGTSAVTAFIEDVQLPQGPLNHTNPNEFIWPAGPRKKPKREVVFARATIECKSKVEAKGQTRYHPVRYKVMEDLIRKFEEEIFEDDEEVLMLIV